MDRWGGPTVAWRRVTHSWCRPSFRSGRAFSAESRRAESLMPAEIRSYTSLKDCGVGRFDEFRQLFIKAMRGDRMVEHEVRWILDLIRRAETLVVQRTG